MNQIVEQMNQQAFENLTRKLNEANSRIVEFEDIKKGHLEFIKGIEKVAAEITLKYKESENRS